MGFFDSISDTLFGSGDETKVEPHSTMTPEQNQLMSELIGYVKPEIGQTGRVYDGQRVADPTALQTQSFQSAGDFLSNSQNILDQIMAKNITAQGPQSYDFDQGQVEDYFNTSIADPARQRFEDDVMPALIEQFNAIDATDSGAARRAIAGARGDFELGLTSQMSDLIEAERNKVRDLNFTSGEAYANRDLSAQVYDINRLINGGSVMSPALETALNAGGQEFNINQANIDAEMQKFMEADPANNTALKFLQLILQQPQFKNIAYTNQGSGGMLGGILGGASQGIGGAIGDKVGGWIA